MVLGGGVLLGGVLLCHSRHHPRHYPPCPRGSTTPCVDIPPLHPNTQNTGPSSWGRLDYYNNVKKCCLIALVDEQIKNTCGERRPKNVWRASYRKGGVRMAVWPRGRGPTCGGGSIPPPSAAPSFSSKIYIYIYIYIYIHICAESSIFQLWA